MINFCFLDAVKAERYQDAIMRARKKIQHFLDEQTAIHQTKVEAVSVWSCLFHKRRLFEYIKSNKLFKKRKSSFTIIV